MIKAKHLVWIRRISQTLFLGLFLVLLVESRLPETVYLEYSLYFSGDADIRLDQPVTFFFDLDPLVWLSSLLSGHGLIQGFGWALAVVVLTLLLGRVFCGFICPLGTIHHAVSWMRPALKGAA
ncbi:MAG: 4Fe-4S binding protein, partial [Thermodesulfobacteriota bacterium]|nr:4Fe-4S binding protein [Thermodesulfobacteriota bacterium]